MNYYILTYIKHEKLECETCMQKNTFIISKINYAQKENNKNFKSKCPSVVLDYLPNIFIKNSRKIITKQPIAFCLESFYIDDLIYKLIL